MKYSAMIVDDSPTDRYLLRRYLQKTEMITEIIEAENGEDALKRFIDYRGKKETLPDGFPPALLFLDINMPKLNGFEFLEKFEALQEEHSVVIMMFTSSASKEDKEKAFSFSNVKDYLEKGAFKAEDIKKKILMHLG